MSEPTAPVAPPKVVLPFPLPLQSGVGLVGPDECRCRRYSVGHIDPASRPAASATEVFGPRPRGFHDRSQRSLKSLVAKHRNASRYADRAYEALVEAVFGDEDEEEDDDDDDDDDEAENKEEEKKEEKENEEKAATETEAARVIRCLQKFVRDCNVFEHTVVKHFVLPRVEELAAARAAMAAAPAEENKKEDSNERADDNVGAGDEVTGYERGYWDPSAEWRTPAAAIRGLDAYIETTQVFVTTRMMLLRLLPLATDAETNEATPGAAAYLASVADALGPCVDRGGCAARPEKVPESERSAQLEGHSTPVGIIKTFGCAHKCNAGEEGHDDGQFEEDRLWYPTCPAAATANAAEALRLARWAVCAAGEVIEAATGFMFNVQWYIRDQKFKADRLEKAKTAKVTAEVTAEEADEGANGETAE